MCDRLSELYLWKTWMRISLPESFEIKRKLIAMSLVVHLQSMKFLKCLYGLS